MANYLAGIKVQEDTTLEFSVYGSSAGEKEDHIVNGFYITPLIDGYFIDWDAKTFDGFANGQSFWLGLTSNKRTQRPGKYGYGYWVTGMHSSSSTNSMKGIDPESLGLVMGIIPNNPTGIYYDIKPNWTWDNEKWSMASRNASSPKISWSEIKVVYNAFLSDAFQQCIGIYKPSFTLYEFWDSGKVEICIRDVNDGYNYESGAHGGRSRPAGSPFATANRKCWRYCLKDGKNTIKEYNLKDLVAEQWNTIKCDVEPGYRFCIEWDDKRGDMYNLNWNTWAYSILYFDNSIKGWVKRNEI